MEYTLDRFRSTHVEAYQTALQEIKAGKKQSHWMWYIFPQIQGLGHSAMAMYYEIQSKEEALAYWHDPVLNSHMIEICRELMKRNASIDDILGFPDNLKLRSCMTLFWLVSGEQIFKDILDKFFFGSLDAYTEHKLNEIEKGR